MKVAISIILFLFSFDALADYGTVFIFKCQFTTNDSVINGYISTYGDDFSPKDWTLFKFDPQSYSMELFTYIKCTDNSQIRVSEFAHVMDFDGDTVSQMSDEGWDIQKSTLTDLKVVEIVSFPMVPCYIISTLKASDASWLKNPHLDEITFNQKDDCTGMRFLIYEKNEGHLPAITDYLYAHNKNNGNWINDLTMELRKYKVVLVKFSYCG